MAAIYWRLTEPYAITKADISLGLIRLIYLYALSAILELSMTYMSGTMQNGRYLRLFEMYTYKK